MQNKSSYKDKPSDEYRTFKKGDRFHALLIGYGNTYRVAKVELRVVLYPDGDQCLEPVVITKSGLVWTTHVCGALLSYFGRTGIDYECAGASKTWLSYKLDKGEIKQSPYALGEE
jgi:hypothetical protein